MTSTFDIREQTFSSTERQFCMIKKVGGCRPNYKMIAKLFSESCQNLSTLYLLERYWLSRIFKMRFCWFCMNNIYVCFKPVFVVAHGSIYVITKRFLHITILYQTKRHKMNIMKSEFWLIVALWHHVTTQTLVNIDSADFLCPTAPNHYMNRSWLVIIEGVWHSTK